MLQRSTRCLGHALYEANAPAQTSGAQLVSLTLDNVCPTSDSGAPWRLAGGAADTRYHGEHRLAGTSLLLGIMKRTEWVRKGGFAVWWQMSLECHQVYALRERTWVLGRAKMQPHAAGDTRYSGRSIIRFVKVGPPSSLCFSRCVLVRGNQNRNV